MKEVRDFGEEIAKIMPLLLREITRKKVMIFSTRGIMVTHIAILEYISEKGVSVWEILLKCLI